MSQIQCNFFGQFEVVAAGEQMTGFHSDKARALFAYLLLEPQMHARRVLAGLLWPDIGDKYALTNLRNTLYRLRQTLDAAAPDLSGQLLQVTRRAVQCNQAMATVDVHQFQCLLQNGVATRAASELDTQETERAAAAVALYQGELLAGFSVADSPSFEEWLLLRREVLHQRALLACGRLAATLETAGDYQESYVVTSRLLALDPTREETWRTALRLLARLGQTGQALQQYEQMRQRFHDDLGVSPSPETQTLVKQIVAGAFASPAEDRVAAPVALVPEASTPEAAGPPPATARPGPVSPQELGDLPEVGPFFGRVYEHQRLEQWLVRDHCRVVALVGIGGVGKTTLAARLAHTVADTVDIVIWRSLLNAPPLVELLLPLLQRLDPEQFHGAPDQLDAHLHRLLDCLRSRRILLVLDNLESILGTQQAGLYRAGYEAYGQLLQLFAGHDHQSHLLVTSRERPPGVARWEGDSPLVRMLTLEGLDGDAGQALLAQRGLHAADREAAALVGRYSGNPLALKLVADTVDEIFGGDVAEFLTDESMVFDDIRVVLDQQFVRLSRLEQEILYWLAVEREPVSAAQLRNQLLHRPAPSALIEALRGLHRRSLVEQPENGLALQNVITEYLTDRLVRAACHELETGEIQLLHQQPLLKALAKEYVRQSQVRMLLAPVGAHLQARLGRAQLGARLREILEALQRHRPHTPSYAPGVILNLMLHLQLDVTGFDFSQLPIWQVYLRGAALPGVNFAGADFAHIALTDTFGDIRSLAVSPDGQMIAAGTAAGEVSLWRLADTQLLEMLRDDAAPIWAVAFSPDGTLLAAGGTDGLVRLWDVQHAQLRTTLPGHDKTIRCVIFSPDGALLASSGDDRTIRLWDVHSETLQQVLANGHGMSVRTFVFTADRATGVSASDDAKILVWDLRAGQIQRTLLGHTGWVHSLALSPDEKVLASGSYDHTVRLWDLSTGSLRQTLQGHTGWVESVSFSPDGKLVASGSDDRTVRLWSVERGTLVHTLRGHSGWINSVKFSPNGETLVSGDDDRNLFVWNVRTRQPYHHLTGHLLSVESVAFSSDGAILASGNGDQTVRFWRLAADLDRSNENNEKNEYNEYTHKSAYEPHGSVRYTTYGHPVHVGHAVVIDIAAGGNTLACGTADRTLHLIDMAQQQIRHTLRGHSGWIKSVAFDPAGSLVASGSTDQTIRLWDVQNGQLVRLLDGLAGWVNALAFAPQAPILASGDGDATITLWDLSSGQPARTLTGHRGWVNDLCFTPDGSLLISAGADGTIRFWEVNSGALLHVLDAHQGWVWKVSLLADASLLASGSYDRTVCIWDVSTALAARTFSQNRAGDRTDAIRPRHTLRGHSPWVTDIALNASARVLASSSGRQTIRLWQIDTGRCIQVLQIPGPYEGMNITGVTGISGAQRTTLKALGAVEEDG